MHPPLIDRRRAAEAGLVWSAALALGLWLGRRPRSSPSAGAVEVWVADRGADRLVGLDRFLRSVATFELEAPERLVWGADGTIWALAGERVLGRGPHGQPVDPRVGDGLELTPLRGGDLVVLARGGALWRCDASGGRRFLLALAGARSVAASGDTLLVAVRGAGLAVVEAGRRPAVVGHGPSSGDVQELAPVAGPGGGWWVLEGPADAREGTRRLTLLDASGAGLWSRSVPARAAGLAPASEGVWLLDPARPGLVRFGHAARRSGAFELSPALRSPRAVTAAGPGLLLATAGALVALSPEGRSVGSQGGFADLVSVAARAGPASSRPAPAG